jgi:hypothetical protein
MRQVPEKKSATYLIVGNGRVARHFIHYFTSLQISFRQFTRNSDIAFQECLIGCTHVLVLISDREIVPFIAKYRGYGKASIVWVHFSGLLNTELAHSAHPLAAFSNRFFDTDFYKTIPFALVRGGIPFTELLPGLPNPYFEIDHGEKERYHAMCVVAGNFSTLLWMRFAEFLNHEIKVPERLMFPYLRSTLYNLENADDPLSGPLKRNDQETIQRNLAALEGTSVFDLYKAFLKFYSNQHEDEKHT